MRYVVGLFLAALLAVTFAGCGGGSSGTATGTGTQPGTLGVSLTDTPACGFDAVYITVNKVRVHQSESAGVNASGWADITLDPPRKINLLDLTNGVLEQLGQVALAAGSYTQLRLVLDANEGFTTANSVIPSGTGTEIALDTPSAVQSGIKLTHAFNVASGERVDLVLDFDACKSVVSRGNGSYALRPVVSVIPTVANGISGFVDTSLLDNNVTVSAQVDGMVIRSTTPNALTGEFFLARLPLDTYDVVITADGYATAVIAGVPIVSTTATVMVSTSAAPIMLMASATGNISGTVTLNPLNSSEAAYVMAKQTIDVSVDVTVKTEGADALSGEYTMALPKAAPWLGQYGTGALPITLMEQTSAAGQYSLEASASGYQFLIYIVNITTADVTQDFTLVL